MSMGHLSLCQFPTSIKGRGYRWGMGHKQSARDFAEPSSFKGQAHFHNFLMANCLEFVMKSGGHL